MLWFSLIVTMVPIRRAPFGILFPLHGCRGGLESKAVDKSSQHFTYRSFQLVCLFGRTIGPLHPALAELAYSAHATWSNRTKWVCQ